MASAFARGHGSQNVKPDHAQVDLTKPHTWTIEVGRDGHTTRVLLNGQLVSGLAEATIHVMAGTLTRVDFVPLHYPHPYSHRHTVSFDTRDIDRGVIYLLVGDRRYRFVDEEA
jgi:hypothetical protein